MRVLLPLIGYLLALALCRSRANGWRIAILSAAGLWALVVVLLTEGLSLVAQLSTRGLTAAWVGLDLCLLTVVWRTCSRRDLRLMSEVPFRRLDRALIVLMAGIGIICALVGLTAIVSPPNTFDVMCYHLPRIVNWLQQGSLRFYPTQDTRQLALSPGSEYLVLQMHALWGGDRFDNIFQFLSYAGSILGVSLIAQELGAGIRGQILAAVVCATIPEGILQASDAKNDYVLAFWIVCSVIAWLKFSRTRDTEYLYAGGVAIGLACLTKDTAPIFIPSVLTSVSLAWSKTTWKVAIGRLPALLLIVATINAGYWTRNYQRYGSVFGPPASDAKGDYKYTNDGLNPEIVASNMIRETALHLSTPSRFANSILERFSISLLHAIGANENDSRTTFKLTEFRIAPFIMQETLKSNLIHLGLIVVTLLIVLISPSSRSSLMLFYVCGIIAAFVVFCAVLKWSPWHVRLHIPLFVLFAPAIGTVFERRWQSSVTMRLALALLVLSLPVALTNWSRPLMGEGNIMSVTRESLYFREHPTLFEPYREAAMRINATDCGSIGLRYPDGYQYPLLVLMGAESGNKNVRSIEAERDPCAVICVDCTDRKRVTYQATVGPASVFQNVVVFQRTPPSTVLSTAPGHHD